MADSEDEKVDGLQIAAEILNRMKGGSKDRIVKAIRRTDPELATKIEERAFNFDSMLELTAQSMQVLLAAVNQADIVLSMKTASDELKAVLLQNMSERRRGTILDEFKNLPPVRLSEVEAAQRRILGTIEELRSQGKIKTGRSNDIWV